MLKRYDQVLLLCPVAATGGPEALHQLAQLINEVGIPAQIAYYGRGARIGVERGSLICGEPSDNICLSVYGKYNPIVAKQVILTEETLVILPEVRIAEAGLFAPADVAIWWLSVANAFHASSPLLDRGKKDKFFGDVSIHHFCQTFYSRELLKQNGVTRQYDLVDYTDDLFTLQRPKSFHSGSEIAFNPKKGSGLSEAFFTAHPDLKPRRIERMAKGEISTTLKNTQIYIEFGHNPGKDRMPREAAASGCIVLANKQGGTMFFDDVPLDEEYKFDATDVSSGKLYSLVRNIMADLKAHWEKQDYYRRYVYSEKELMQLQVRRIFGYS